MLYSIKQVKDSGIFTIFVGAVVVGEGGLVIIFEGFGGGSELICSLLVFFLTPKGLGKILRNSQNIRAYYMLYILQLLKPGPPRQCKPITGKNRNKRFQHFQIQPTKCRVKNNEISTCLLTGDEYATTEPVTFLSSNCLSFSSFEFLRFPEVLFVFVLNSDCLLFNGHNLSIF